MPAGIWLFGLATLRAGILQRWPAGLLVLASALAPVAALLPLEHQPLVAVPMGLALAWLGYGVGPNGAASQPRAGNTWQHKALNLSRVE